MDIRTWVLPLAALLAFTGACSKKPAPADPAAKAPVARAVTVAQIVLRPLAGTFVASGLLVPREEAAVGSELSGYRVAAVLHEEGAFVKKGEPLAHLDPGLLQAKIAQAAASVEQAKAQAAQARSEAARVAGLDGTGILSDEQINTRRSQAKSANAAVAVVEAQLNDLSTQKRRMVIRAPISGTVLQRSVRPGDIATPTQTMFRIARDGLIELDAEVPEDALARVTGGNTVTVTLPSGTVLVGEVRLISPRVDPQTKLGRVRVSLPRSADLRAGGFARAEFTRAATPVPAVPEKAVQFEASGPLLVVIDQSNRAHRVAIKTGARADGFVAIDQGPPVGTRVALGGGAFLLDGDLVEPVAPAEPQPATPAAPAARPGQKS
jgi:HlyD family secretion protein